MTEKMQIHASGFEQAAHKVLAKDSDKVINAVTIIPAHPLWDKRMELSTRWVGTEPFCKEFTNLANKIQMLDEIIMDETGTQSDDIMMASVYSRETNKSFKSVFLG